MAKRTYSFEWDGKRVEYERPKFGQFEALVEAQTKLDALEKSGAAGTKEWSDMLRAVFHSANIPDDVIDALYDDEIGAFYIVVTNAMYPNQGAEEGNPNGGGSAPTSPASGRS